MLMSFNVCAGCTPEDFPEVPPCVKLPEPTGQSKAILDGNITVESDEYVDFTFNVNTETMHNVRVVGWFMACGGAQNDIDVLILNDIDFINWDNLHEVEAVYKSGKITIAEMDVPIADSGDYHLVLDNSFSEFTSKNVSAQVYLYWSE